MVDLLFMRCKDVFVSDVWVDVYVTPFLYASSDQTSMLGLVRGMGSLHELRDNDNIGAPRRYWYKKRCT
jgi:hypothetical protein